MDYYYFRSRRNESVDRSLLYPRSHGGSREKALSATGRRVRDTTRLPRDEATSVDQLGISTTKRYQKLLEFEITDCWRSITNGVVSLKSY